VVEAEGYGSSITRVMHYGLSRRGGLPSLSSLPERLQEIADRIGWGDRPLEEMIGPWDREESYEEATYRERVESERRARSLSSHTYGGSRGEEQA
jgi:hypothetical protein